MDFRISEKFRISRKLVVSFEEKPQVKNRFEIMRRILLVLQDKPLLFKGGSAIMFFYEGDRFSEGLVFDVCVVPHSFSALRTAAQLSKRLGFEVSVVKDTEATKRLKVKVPDLSKGIKIEFSFRRILRGDDLKSYGKGMGVYSIGEIARMKLQALKERTAARDLYDIAFIMDVWSSELSDDVLKEILTFFQEKSVEDRMTAFEESFVEDPRLGEGAFYLTYGRLLDGVLKIEDFLNRRERQKKRASLNFIRI